MHARRTAVWSRDTASRDRWHPTANVKSGSWTGASGSLNARVLGEEARAASRGHVPGRGAACLRIEAETGLSEKVNPLTYCRDKEPHTVRAFNPHPQRQEPPYRPAGPPPPSPPAIFMAIVRVNRRIAEARHPLLTISMTRKIANLAQMLATGRNSEILTADNKGDYGAHPFAAAHRWAFTLQNCIESCSE